MSCFEIQECGYTGQVWLGSRHPRQFYFYSVSRNPQREQLFDGVAGDMAEALSTLQAHIHYLASEGGLAARKVKESYEEIGVRAGELRKAGGHCPS